MLASLFASSPIYAVHEDDFPIYGDTMITYCYFCDIDIYEEVWVWCDDVSINGKTYKRLYRAVFENETAETNLTDSNSDNWWGARDYATRATGYVINIREEEGRIFADRSMYEQFIHELFPQKEDIYLGTTVDPEEVLLYDFNLQKGDAYPCQGDVTVQETALVTTLFGTKHRVQYLSNGATLIEGIGCVNSIGGIIAYQNTELTGHLSKPAVSWSTETKLIAEFQEINWGNHGLNFFDFTAIRDLPAQPATGDSGSMFNVQRSTYYDLSGRRLSAPPAKGMYIEDKRVKIRE